MSRVPSPAETRGTDLVYTGIALVAAVLTAIGEQFHPLVVAAVAVALVPWALLVAGIRLPHGAFAALGIIPMIPVVVCTGIGSAIFLYLATCSRLASRSDQRWLVGLLAALAIGLPFAALPGESEWDVGVVYFAFGGAFAVLVGVLLRRATRLGDELRLADAELAAAAAREERHRLARDVHDLVAHSLTVVVLHVGGARRLLRSDPAAAEVALEAAERVSRESLDAIRRAVGLLRETDEPPMASLDLERLVTTYRSAGMPVTMQLDGAPDALPLASRVTLYRVIQEALANAARHSSPGTPASVHILIDDHELVARVENQIDTRRRPAAESAGYGLVGLREQATSLGGDLTSGPEDDRWIVVFRLPRGEAA
jgi:signal transduction histidine kinase